MRSASAAANASRRIHEQHSSSDPVVLITLYMSASFQIFIVLSDLIQSSLESMESEDSKNIEIFLSERS